LTSTDLQGTPLRAHDVSQLVGRSGGDVLMGVTELLAYDDGAPS
jgi:hypothetical protein